MSPTFVLLYTIANEKTVKLTQIDRILASFETFPAETRSNNSGRYTLLSLIYLDNSMPVNMQSPNNN